MKVPKKCNDCIYKSTDSCRDAYWWICSHEVFKIGKEPIIELKESPLKICPLKNNLLNMNKNINNS